MIEVELANESVILYAERAMSWPRHRTLFIADPHWGKADAFRAAGVPVPNAGTTHDLQRLQRLLDAAAVQRLVILGDLFHARASRSHELFESVRAWRNAWSGEVLLIRGNHDRHAGDPPPEWHFETVNEPYSLGPFALRHYPEPSSVGYTLAGHLHPAVRLSGIGRQKLILPCFHFGATVGTLPAFGGFTGTATIRPMQGDQVYAIAEQHVIPIHAPRVPHTAKRPTGSP
jgi:DNA ligase-associated metallophosphoesterase